MVRTFTILFSMIVLGGASTALAELEPAENAPVPSSQTPVVSELGKRRLKKNLTIIEDSIRDLKDNLKATKQNIVVIETEMKELDALKAEHLELRKKYLSYLKYAEGEMAKHEKASRDLASWEKKQVAAGKALKDEKKKKELDDRLAAARQDLLERENWSADAKGKIARVKELLAGIKRNVQEIDARLLPLSDQKQSWQKRQKDYEQLLEKSYAKKSEIERIVRSVN